MKAFSRRGEFVIEFAATVVHLGVDIKHAAYDKETNVQ